MTANFFMNTLSAWVSGGVLLTPTLTSYCNIGREYLAVSQMLQTRIDDRKQQSRSLHVLESTRKAVEQMACKVVAIVV
jgi:hypothetical protein